MSQEDSNLDREDDDLPDGKPAATSKPAAPAAAAVKEPEPAKKPVEEPAPKHPKSQRQRKIAEELGFAQVDIDELSVDDLWSEINRFRDLQFAEYQRNNTGKQAKPAAGANVAPQPEPVVADPLDAFDNEETYTPEVKHLAGEVKALRKLREEVAELKKEAATRQWRTMQDAIDAAFEPLEKDHADMIGEGGIEDLAKSNNDAAERRYMVYNLAGIQNTDSPQQMKRKIAAAFRRLQTFAGKKSETPAPAPEKNGYEQPSGAQLRAGQVVMPTSRAGAAEPKGVGRAKQVVHAHMSANGMHPGRLDEDDDSDLVD